MVAGAATLWDLAQPAVMADGGNQFQTKPRSPVLIRIIFLLTNFSSVEHVENVPEIIVDSNLKMAAQNTHLPLPSHLPRHHPSRVRLSPRRAGILRPHEMAPGGIDRS